MAKFKRKHRVHLNEKFKLFYGDTLKVSAVAPNSSYLENDRHAMKSIAHLSSITFRLLMSATGWQNPLPQIEVEKVSIKPPNRKESSHISHCQISLDDLSFLREKGSVPRLF